MHQITVVLEHPSYCDLSSIILQEEFERYADACVYYRGMCDMYTQGYYAVVYNIEEPFNIDKYNVLLGEMRNNQPWSRG
jgi:hypothetical protein